MDLAKALAVFTELEAHRYEDEEGPVFDVRLDASTGDAPDTRAFRIRVKLGGGMVYVSGETWEMVTGVAIKYGLESRLANDGIELLVRED